MSCVQFQLKQGLMLSFQFGKPKVEAYSDQSPLTQTMAARTPRACPPRRDRSESVPCQSELSWRDLGRSPQASAPNDQRKNVQTSWNESQPRQPQDQHNAFRIAATKVRSPFSSLVTQKPTMLSELE